MAFKFVVDSLDDIEEVFRPLYAEIEGENGTKRFQLQVEGVVPSAKLDEFRNNNVEL
jgi:hypothetical protein